MANLEFGSKCLTDKAGALSKIWEIELSKALKGSAKFSSLQRKQMTSTVQIFPTHLQAGESTTTALLWSKDLILEEEWWSEQQDQTLTWLSPDFFNADNASATVAPMGTHLRGGFPKQRSDTSRLFKKLTAMQERKFSNKEMKLRRTEEAAWNWKRGILEEYILE